MSYSRKVVLLLSGGLDSVVLMHALAKRAVPDRSDWPRYEVHAMWVDYGQRNAPLERAAAQQACRAANLGVDAVPLTEWPAPVLGSPDGADPVVPARNAVLLSLATCLAMEVDAEEVMLGSTAGDAARFPDCRAAFLQPLSDAFHAAYGVRVDAPFLYHQKRDVAKLGRALGVDLDATYSCYRGTACGECVACVARKEALA